METVTERLLHEERKLTDGESSYRNDGEKAMAVRRQKSWAPKCYKLGHIKRDCPELDSQRDTKSENKSKGKHKGKSKSHKAHKTKVEKRDSGDSDSDCVGLTVRHVLSVCDAGSDKCIIDSGATCHMSTDRSQFSDYRPLDIPLGVTLGDGHHLKSVGHRSVTLVVETPSGKGKKCNLSDVLYVPNLSYNLLCV